MRLTSIPADRMTSRGRPARMTASRDLLRIENLSVGFPLYGGHIQAVQDVSLRILPGRVTSLVGQSGSGKSVIGRTVMGLQSRTADVCGAILFDDPQAPPGAPVDLATLPVDGRQIRAIRGNRIGMIFQEPMSSFSPVHTIGNQIDEALRIHSVLTPRERAEQVEQMLSDVGFRNPAGVMRMYPFELSGGMRQRAMVAMALICDPALLIADEPTTALDVTIQGKLLKLLRHLQEQRGMAILLITHDLAVIAETAHRVAVMYAGRIVEIGEVKAIFEHPRHPYTQGLLRSIPEIVRDRPARLNEIAGVVPNLARLGRGCSFADRCPKVIDRCRTEAPALSDTDPGHLAACWRAGDA